MFHKRETDVLVVGAGPVGLFTALQLARRGVAVEIVDSQQRPAARSYALALHPSSLALLDEIGLLDELVAHGHRIHTVAFYDGVERRCALDLSRLPAAFPFALVLPQQAFEQALETRLREEKLEVQWCHRLRDLETGGKRVVAKLDKLGREPGGYAVATTGWVVDKTLQTWASYVIGADGHHSAVRRALGVELEDLGESRFFGVFELTADAEDLREVRVVLDKDTTNVLWPLGGGRFRWSFQLEDDWEFLPDTRVKKRLAVQLGDEAFPYLDEACLQELLAARAPWFDARVDEILWSIAIRFENRLAPSFGRRNVWLAGDAAHLAAPMGVHSMNVGLREGYDLAEHLGDILQHGASPDQLEAYGEACEAEWRKLLGAGPGLVVGAEADAWVRQHAERLPACVPTSGADLSTLLSQAGLQL